jgi:hypothetical protein
VSGRERAAGFSNAACNRGARRSSSPGWVVWIGGGPRARAGGLGRGMVRAGVVLVAALSLARPVPAAAAPAPRAPRQAAAEREWTVRSAALDAEAHADTLLARLSEDAWRSRVSALDALARAAELGDPVPAVCAPAVVAALRDPHPNVRALALAAATGLVQPPPAAVLDAAGDRLPVVRLALARALPELAARELLPGRDAASGLVRLAGDVDARVSAAARSGLLGLDSGDPAVRELQVTWLAGALAGPRAQSIETAHLLARAAPSAELVDAAVAGALARGRENEVVLAALAWGLGAAPSPVRTPTALLAGWEAEPEPRLETLLMLAVRSRDGALARACLAGLEGLSPDDPRRTAWIDLFVELVGPSRVAGVLHDVVPSDALTASVLEELGRRLDALPASEFASWGRADQPLAVRRALLEAAASAHARAQDAGARQLLALLLGDEDPGLARRAFAALAGARVGDPAVDVALHGFWRRLGEAERDDRLGDLTRERPLVPFREDWLVLGARGGAVRRTACELLTPFGHDPALAAAVETWLDVDLARLVEREPTRALEFQVQADLRALRALAGPDAVAPFARALEAALGRSTEVGKVACAALGRGLEGRTLLAQRLESGALARDVDRRTRIEAAIVLARHEAPPGQPSARRVAVVSLLADHGAAAPDLLERMLDALAASRDGEALAAFEAWALDPALGSLERVGALARLAAVRAPRALETAEAAARSRLDLETRRAGLRALGAIAGPDAANRLAGLFEAWFPEGAGEGGDRDASGLDPEAAMVVRGDLLEALGRSGHFPAWLEPVWLAGPLAWANRDLASRHAGEDLARTDFRWRAELALAPELARRGRLEQALPAAGEWWRADASFLLALGERLAALDDAAARAASRTVLRAALVGLAGESQTPAALTVRARRALLDLEWRAERFTAAARLLADLRAQRRSGEADGALWTHLFGAVDAHSDRDPDARLRALEQEARARAR